MTKLQIKDNRKGLIVICTSSFLFPFMGSALVLALPEISNAFSMKAVTLTWMALSYMISTAVFQIPMARLADLIGRKKVFIIGTLIFALCTGLCGFAPNSSALITLRFLSGIGSAMLSGTNMAILTSLFSPESRGKALGINTAVVYASLAAGPFLGGVLTYYLGWQSIFFVCASGGIVVLILSRFFLRGEWIASEGEKFDFIGSLLYIIGLAGIIAGFSNLKEIIGIIFLVAGTVSFLVFLYYQKFQPYPVFNIDLLFKNKVFRLSSLASLINYAATAAISFLLSLYLQYVRGLEAYNAGMILISQAAVQSIFSLIAGNLTTRFNSSILATTGMSIIVAGLAGLIFIDTTTSYTVIICLLALLGMGFGIFSSPNTNVIMSSVNIKNYNQASAISGTMRQTGMAFSMGIAGLLIAFYIGNEKITPDLYPAFMQSMKMTFIVFLILCLFGVYASSARLKKEN